MNPSDKKTVRTLNRHIRKYSLISLPATLIIGFGVYLLLTGRGGEFHPWLAESAFVIKLMVVAGVIELMAMNRITRLKRLKQVVVPNCRMERQSRALY